MKIVELSSEPSKEEKLKIVTAANTTNSGSPFFLNRVLRATKSSMDGCSRLPVS